MGEVFEGEEKKRTNIESYQGRMSLCPQGDNRRKYLFILLL